MILYDKGIKLGSTDGKVIDTILGNLDGIALGIDVGNERGYLDGAFDDFNDGKLEVIFLGDSLGFTVGKVLVYDEGIKLGSTDGYCFGTKLGNVYGITLGIEIGTELGYLDGSFDGCYDKNLNSYYLGHHWKYLVIKWLDIIKV